MIKVVDFFISSTINFSIYLQIILEEAYSHLIFQEYISHETIRN